VASSWAAGALLAAAAVVAANGWLGERAARRQSGLLGAPAADPSVASRPTVSPSATPAPVAPAAPEAAPAAAPPPLLAAPAGPQDAKYWQDRAQKLQETIDDPRKLEAYFAQKAQHEYDVAKVESIDVSGAPMRGPASAPVKVVEYSDFLCPFCRNLAGALVQFIPQAGGRVAVYFKNYPLDADCNPKLTQSTHPGACNVALGAVCAQRQGKFEAYHDRVFATDLRNPTPADVVRVAGEAGLNGAAMQGCLEDAATKEALAAQIAEANRLGVNATPTLYVNGRKLPRINDFVAVVDKEARRKGFPPLAPGQ
jgi:protein-disulfide isomerase